MGLEQVSTLDRLAFSQMILAALSHDFVTPFRAAISSCREIREFAERSTLYSGADLAQLDGARQAVSKTLFPKLTRLHDEATHFHGSDPNEMVEFLIRRVDAEIAERLSDLRAILDLADRRNPHGVLDLTLNELETATRKIAAMMEGIKATVAVPPSDVKKGLIRVSESVDSVQELLRPLEPGLSVETRGEAYIEGDPWRIWSVFSNLIGNAIKYSKPNHAPSVEIRIGVVSDPVRLSFVFRNRLEKDRVADKHYKHFIKALSNGDGWCEFNVTDHGLGIPIKKQWGIFKLFKQLHVDSSHQPKDAREAERRMLEAYQKLDAAKEHGHAGIGMGLALTQYYVRSQGGEISVSSKVGGPTTFGIWFPSSVAGVAEAVELRQDTWWR